MQTNETIDVGLFLEQMGIRGFHWFTLAILFMIAMLAGFDATTLMSAALPMAAELKIPAMSFGLMAATGNLLGPLVGAFCSGPLADRNGRKPVLVGSVFTLALGSLLTPLASGADGVSIWNLVRSFGVGAALPAAATLMNEHSSAKARAVLTSAVLFGFPAGVGLNFLFAKWMIGAWGWRSVFALDGAVLAAFAILVAFWLPESAIYMATSPHISQITGASGL